MVYKKPIKLILLYLFLISSIIGHAASDSKENAADYYLRAWDLMKFPKELQEKIILTIKNGFQGNENQLKQLLTQNKDAFKELKKGVTLSNCDFSIWKKQNKKVANHFTQARSFIWLVLLQGRFYESNDNLNEAADSYISSLALTKHISQNATQQTGLITYKIQAAFIDIMYLPLKDLLGSKKVSRQSAKKILSALNDYEKNSLTLEKAMLYEQQLFKNEYVQGIINDALRKQKQPLSKKDEMLFKNTFEKEGNKLADEYYGYYMKAIKTKQQSDWDIVRKEIIELDKEIPAAKINFLARFADIFVTLIFSKEKGWEKTARLMAKMWLLATLPNPDEIQSMQFKYLEQLKDLRTLAESKSL